MSKALPSYFYRDPMEVLERKQEAAIKKSCVGCIHSYKLEFKSGVEFGCNMGRRYGKRCQHYRRVD